MPVIRQPLYVVLVFILIDPRESECQAGVVLLHAFHPLIDVDLSIGSRHKALVPLPVAALVSAKRLDGQSAEGFHYESSAAQRVVDAQRTLLVGAQDESRAKLLVERADGELGPVQLTFHVVVGYAPSLEVVLEARQRVLQIFHADASLEVLVLQHQVDVGVGLEVLRLLSPYLLVGLWHQHVALH